MKITEDVARTYGAHLTAAEIAWQRALGNAGTNLTQLAVATEAGEIGIGVCAELFEMAAEGIAHLIGAGKSYARLHDRSSALARLSGLDPTSFGFSTTPSAEAATQPGGLRIVPATGQAAAA